MVFSNAFLQHSSVTSSSSSSPDTGSTTPACFMHSAAGSRISFCLLQSLLKTICGPIQSHVGLLIVSVEAQNWSVPAQNKCTIPLASWGWAVICTAVTDQVYDESLCLRFGWRQNTVSFCSELRPPQKLSMPDFSVFCFEMGLHQNISVYFGSLQSPAQTSQAGHLPSGPISSFKPYRLSGVPTAQKQS